MKPKYQNGNVIAVCPICGVQTTFEAKQHGAEFGSIVMDHPNQKGWPGNNSRIVFRLVKCASCGRAGLASVSDHGQVDLGELVEFLPMATEKLPLPTNTPKEIESEFREAEKDASVGCYRSASAMLRSTLEKTLKNHGYKSGGLEEKINKAAEDQIVTIVLKIRAHENIRVLGNNVMHDDWREVSQEEYDISHSYTKSVLDCFFDDPPTVKKILIEKGRLTEEGTVETESTLPIEEKD